MTMTIEEAAKYDLLQSRAILSENAHGLCAAKVREAAELQAPDAERQQLNDELAAHVLNINRFNEYHAEMQAKDAKRVAGVTNIPHQIGALAGQRAGYEYDRSKPATPEQKSPYGPMATALQRKRNARIGKPKSMSSRMKKRRDAR